MDIQYIREFVMLSKCGNYMVAADELYISQSSLSKHIMALEKELGIPLFNRTTRKVHLTQYGKAFLPYAKRITEADAEFRNVLTLSKKDAANSVRLGVLPAFLAYNIERAVLDFRERFPHIPISLTESTNEGLLNWLRDGTCNIALVRTFETSLPPEFASIPLLDDTMALIAVSGSIFDDGRTSVTWEDLAHADLLSSTSTMQARILSSLEERSNIRLNIISKLSRSPSIVEMLVKGIGDGALMHRLPSEYYLRQDPDKIRILDIRPRIFSTVSLVYLKDRPMTSAMRSFISSAISHTAQGEYAHVKP